MFSDKQMKLGFPSHLTWQYVLNNIQQWKHFCKSIFDPTYMTACANCGRTSPHSSDHYHHTRLNAWPESKMLPAAQAYPHLLQV